MLIHSLTHFHTRINSVLTVALTRAQTHEFTELCARVRAVTVTARAFVRSVYQSNYKLTAACVHVNVFDNIRCCRCWTSCFGFVNNKNNFN